VSPYPLDLSDSVLQHLRQVAALPDLSSTRYSLETELGRGGLGVVYRAHDRQLDRPVALKVLDPAFSAEASLIARLEHPSIVPVYDAGTLPDGRAFYAMKLIAGTRLDRHAAAHRSVAEALRILRRVGEALAFAHAQGILHRDLKPQNIMLGAFGEVYVMDWGIQAVAGTPGFRAPEPTLERHSDIYSLGALLQFLLPDPPPPALAAIARKAMQPDPAARYSDASALLADLSRYEDGLAVEAWCEPLLHRLARFWSRNALLLWLLTAYAVVKLGIFFWPKH